MKNPTTCVIIDDEKLARKTLKLLLKTYKPNITVIGEAKDKNSINQVLNNLNPDIIFCDIQLEKQTIFDLLPKYKVINSKIIFISAHEEFALKGYKHNAIDYLLKPLDPAKLFQAIDKTLQIIEKEKKLQVFNKSPQIILSDNKGSHIIKIKEIMYCIANGNYTSIFLKDNSSIMVSKNLKFFEEKLNYLSFFRPHKSNLINTNYLKLISNDNGGHIVMVDGKKLSISRDKKKLLLNQI
ncbi:LytR/AlgR family response regulator transcription factor [Tenacibaculum sp. ZS6-P6]|uniref:LytR/AlgR family response regulator transcription factor n=1 Tax=Tenacibaculum sp. ZS6-P6 TaxID=3447503 RepID=UPI003F9D0E36